MEQLLNMIIVMFTVRVCVHVCARSILGILQLVYNNCSSDRLLSTLSHTHDWSSVFVRTVSDSKLSNTFTGFEL